MATMNLITTRQAAERTGLDVSTIARRVQLGRMTPAARLVNGQMLWDPDDLDRQIEAEDARQAAS